VWAFTRRAFEAAQRGAEREELAVLRIGRHPDRIMTRVPICLEAA
jgi:hypothetical protein